MSLPWHRDVPTVELLVVDAQYHLAISQQVQHTYATRAEARHIKPDSTSDRREALVSPEFFKPNSMSFGLLARNRFSGRSAEASGCSATFSGS